MSANGNDNDDDSDNANNTFLTLKDIKLHVPVLTCFSTSSGVLRKILSNSATFVRFCFSASLEYNFSLVDLRY